MCWGVPLPAALQMCNVERSQVCGTLWHHVAASNSCGGLQEVGKEERQVCGGKGRRTRGGVSAGPTTPRR
jgi:hypothetical protein